MEIQEIFDRIILRSGQFILKRKNIEIDVDSFRMLVEDALTKYSKAHPYEKKYQVEIGGSGRQFTFTDTYDDELKRVPDWISEATPTRPLGGVMLGYGALGGYSRTTNNELIDPMEAPWVYDKPTLTVPFSSWYRIIACFRHWIHCEETNNGKIYSVPTITAYDDVFFLILQGMFLQGIGRSRRAFTMSDLPITMDADSLASEGENLLEKANDELQNIQKIHLPMG